jgi:glycerol-3-phosphate dehydrogenase
MRSPLDVEAAVVGAGVVGCATALALARRRVSVALMEAEAAPALGASGTNSGILHTGFDSVPGELETELIRLSAPLREGVLAALEVPVLRCGAVMKPHGAAQRRAVAVLATNARRNGVSVAEQSDGSLRIPGEAVTDPVRFTLALAQAAQRHGAELHLAWRVAGIERAPRSLHLHAGEAGSIRCRVAVNCAGLEADTIARLVGDESFEIYARKGEFLVFDPPAGERLEQIILPVPTKRTKGVLVFPTIDGRLIAGPTAVDLTDKRDWSVRPQARDEILTKAVAMYPPLEGAQQIAAYAGLRPAGRDANYVIGASRACPRLVNVAAIRSTGLTASLGIGERVAEIVGKLGVSLGPERELIPGPRPAIDGPWWRQTAEYRSAA